MKKRLALFFILLVSIILLWKGLIFFHDGLSDFFYIKISKPLQEITVLNIPLRVKKEEPELLSEAAISVRINRAGRERTLLKNESARAMPIASLTKLMTALIVLENTEADDYNFSNVATVSKTAAEQNNVPVYGNLKKGETFKIKKLLDLMLVYSSNDAAFALSEVIGQELFIERMNNKAQSLGLKNTRFINATGLDPEDLDEIPNYSTSQELVTLSKYILKNHPLIFEISKNGGPYPTTNGIFDLIIPAGKTLLGGKTGYTEKAGGCMLVILEDKNKNYFINIILGADSPKDRIQEMQKIIDWL